MKAWLLLPLCLLASVRAELTEEQQRVPLEQPHADPAAAKIVLLAGAPSNRPGQHEYFAGCALLMDWLKTVPGVAPVLVANGWPRDASVFDGARSVLFFLDGGAKLSFLEPARLERLRQLAAAGTGFAVLHQAVEGPPELADDFKKWFGAVFQSDIGCRGHWDVRFESIPGHEITHGLAPFELLKDGWLYNLHFADSGVTPLLLCRMPETSRKTAHAKTHAGRQEVVAWAYERPGGGRSFGFTGCDLHANWAEPNQRRLLLNALLWTARLPVPAEGVVSTVSDDDLRKNWDRKVFLPKNPARR
jgi:hypothetical protein